MRLSVLLLTLALLGAPLVIQAAPSEPVPTSLGQALVGFTDEAWPAVAEAPSWHGHVVLDTIPQGRVLVLAATDLAPLLPLASQPGVVYVEDDPVKTALVVPGDAQYSQQYGPALMGAHAAWADAGYGSTDITVAILDTGIRATHEDLGNYIGGYDYVNGDNNPNDDCGHGTHVAGTVGAVTDNGIGVAGMSQASIIMHKVLGPVGGLLTVTCSGSASDIAQAIYDATDAGADIISMSLGGGGSSTEQNAVDYAWNAGVLVVAAAGNDGNSNSVDCPACYDSVIAVAALESDKSKASYSDMGPEVEIAAPGSNVWSTYNSNDASYDSLSGTSMATPHVAGALALALSCDPSLTASQLRNLMHTTAEDLGSSGRDQSFGYGLMRIDNIVAGLTCGGNNGGGNHAPSAAFTQSVNGLTATFDASGSSDADGDSLSYAWTFGDGSTGTGVAPSHTYGNGGTYTVTLTVDDGNGGSGTASQSVTVSGGTPTGCGSGDSTVELIDGQTVTVSFSSGAWTHRKICVPSDATSMSVDMVGESCGVLGCSSDADLYVREAAKPTTSAYDCRPYQSGSTESCTVAPSGAAWWYVSVYGYSGSGSVTLTADHNGAGTPPANQAPTAAFTESCTGLVCNFNAGGSSDPDGDPLSYSWTFGDGATGTGATPSHTYAGTGTYTVTLTVDDGNGGSDSASHSVSVSAPNQAPTATFSESCTDLACVFDASTSSDPDGDALSYSWTFGDGATGTGATPGHTYASAGTYTVSLTVSDGNGGSDSASHSVSVTSSGDPDPSTPNLQSGQATTVTLSGSGDDAHYKIYVSDGTLQVDMTGEACGLLGCSFDADLYVRAGARATDTQYDCRPYQSGSDESCSLTGLAPGWVYVRVDSYSGSGSVTLTATA